MEIESPESFLEEFFLVDSFEKYLYAHLGIHYALLLLPMRIYYTYFLWLKHVLCQIQVDLHIFLLSKTMP